MMWGTARKHGITAEDALAAARNYVVARRVSIPGQEPYRELRGGWDTQGRLLETVVLVAADGTRVVIHAMRMRPAIRRRLGL